MFMALAEPLWIRLTGEDVALQMQPVDPLSLFRGNYVDLTYDIDVGVPTNLERGDAVFVVFDDSRPARPSRATTIRPDLAPNESCIRGEVDSRQTVRLPSLEQYFVTSEDGGRLERDLANMVGIVKTTGGCRSILTAIELE
jgi:hypothetical protein